MTGLAPRLEALHGARIAVLTNRKHGSDMLADEFSRGLASAGPAARIWAKPSPYKPMGARPRRELVEWADGVVATPGDCGHGSSVLRHDIFAIEAAGVPVAWVDTPGRMPKVTRRGRTFDIEYEAT